MAAVAALVLLVLVPQAGGVARAAELTLGFSAEVSSLDPYYHNLGPNLALTHHLFDSLIRRGLGQSLTPGLALSWAPLSDTVWELHLRHDVVFHDGAPFTADDVVASFARAPLVSGPATMALYIRPVTRLEVVDAYTIRLHTDGPYPLLPYELSQFPILPRRVAEASTADFDQGGAVIGTGPFRLVRWQPGERIELAANHDYWGGRPRWERVVLRFLPDNAERLAALAAGLVDVIDNLPSADLKRFRDHPNIRLVLSPTARLIFLRFNFEPRPGSLSDRQGRPLALNPWADRRVRLAVSLALNRAALRDLDMEGLAEPAGQLVPPGYAGASPRLTPAAYDPATARRLMAEAGFGEGFAVTLYGPANRYLNDITLCQTIARMLAVIGIEVSVVTLPAQAFFARAAAGDFPFMLAGWGSSTGESSYALKGLLASRNARPGWGSANHGGYHNPGLDGLLGQALATVDDGARAELLTRAMELAMDDVALVPLHFQMRAVALRRPLQYRPSKEEALLAVDVEPGP